MSPVQSGQDAEWVDKHAASKKLGLSPSRCMGLIGERKVETKPGKNAHNQPITLFSVASLDRYLREHGNAQREGVAIVQPAVRCFLCHEPASPGSALCAAHSEIAVQNILSRSEPLPASVTQTVAIPPQPESQPDSQPARPHDFSPDAWPCWLTLDQAVQYSGMTKRWLLAVATAKWPIPILETGTSTVNGVVIRDMGAHSHGGRWRFHRESLGKA